MGINELLALAKSLCDVASTSDADAGLFEFGESLHAGAVVVARRELEGICDKLSSRQNKWGLRTGEPKPSKTRWLRRSE